jgi:hypothetical protein
VLDQARQIFDMTGMARVAVDDAGEAVPNVVKVDIAARSIFD